MITSIFLAAFIFGVLVFAIVYFLQLGVFAGLVVALGGTALFILFEYAIGPFMVKASTKLHYLKPGENPWLEKTVKELADKSGLPMPKLAVVPNNTPNAFTFGRSQSSATLAVHDGLLRSLKEDEIKGVIAHELGHIKHKDYIVMTVLSALPLIAYLIAEVTLITGAFSGGGSGGGKNKKKVLDWVSSANFAELDFCFNVAFAFWTLYSAVIWENVFWFAEFLAEVFVVE